MKYIESLQHEVNEKKVDYYVSGVAQKFYVQEMEKFQEILNDLKKYKLYKGLTNSLMLSFVVLLFSVITSFPFFLDKSSLPFQLALPFAISAISSALLFCGNIGYDFISKSLKIKQLLSDEGNDLLQKTRSKKNKLKKEYEKVIEYRKELLITIDKLENKIKSLNDKKNVFIPDEMIDTSDVVEETYDYDFVFDPEKSKCRNHNDDEETASNNGNIVNFSKVKSLLKK